MAVPLYIRCLPGAIGRQDSPGVNRRTIVTPEGEARVLNLSAEEQANPHGRIRVVLS